MPNILLTGATGFVGSALVKAFEAIDFRCTPVVRKRNKTSSERCVEVGEICATTDYSSAFSQNGIDTVVHVAARAHVSREDVVDSLAEYRKVNVEGTIRLAEEAIIRGVNRFIFISSIGVNGNINTQPFKAEDSPNPADLYAQSKHEAEQALWELTKNTDMELVIIRPPLVYGANAPGNFGSLVRWIEKGIPLPLGAVHNRRTFVSLDNLVDLIITCIEHPGAANQVFLAGDGDDVSTTELLRGVAQAMGKPARLVPVPAAVLQLGATCLGKRAVAQRLLGSLQVDITKAQQILGWKPPLTFEQGLQRCFNDATV